MLGTKTRRLGAAAAAASRTAPIRPKREQFGPRSARTRLPLHGRVAGVDRTAAQSWLCESPDVAHAIALAARPYRQRRWASARVASQLLLAGCGVGRSAIENPSP